MLQMLLMYTWELKTKNKEMGEFNMGRLFGTDGARGVANKELTCELAMKIGRAAAYVLTKHTVSKPKIIIGKDTRVSSTMLEMALASGMCSFGADVILVGFIPTPAVAYLVPESESDAGVMISASHNPCEYNGIKLFDHNGYKLPDCIEEEIESIVLDDAVTIDLPVGGGVGSVYFRHDFVDKYISHILSTVDTDLSGMKIAIDCANGSASMTAQKIFTKLGAQCFMLHCSPNGININDHCGSTCMDDLVDYVNGHNIDLGLAFDGDSDRCLAVDENGKIIDGDQLIAVFANEMKKTDKLNGNTAVVTLMTNLGFSKFAESSGINVAVTGVGDRYVLEEMLKNNYCIGGEQSGHIIFSNHATTGDGQLSGVKFASIMVKEKKKASELASIMKVYPQVLLNVKTTGNAKEIINNFEVQKQINNVSAVLGENGRIVVRPSGTEPIIRVMIEGQDKVYINELALKVANQIKECSKQ